MRIKNLHESNLKKALDNKAYLHITHQAIVDDYTEIVTEQKRPKDSAICEFTSIERIGQDYIEVVDIMKNVYKWIL